MRYLAAVGSSLLVHGHAVSNSGPATEKMITVAVVDVPSEDPAPTFERKEDEGVVEPEVVVAGFAFDVDRIASWL